jgi:carboxypeptidase C (cathepsin A)
VSTIGFGIPPRQTTRCDDSNWVGVQNWLTSNSFDWDGAPYFRALPNRPWFVNDQKAGMTRRYKELTWVTVANAGHMVCEILVSTADW